MYVILDLEWANLVNGQAYPTQIAAARVDDRWHITDIYSALISPAPGSICDFCQVGCSGHTKSEFLSADSAADVFSGLLDWLREDDVLCWWQGEAAQYFEECLRAHTHRPCTYETVTLCKYVLAHLRCGEGFPYNPYKIAERLNIDVPGKMHESLNDVNTVALLLAGIGLDQTELSLPLMVDSRSMRISPYLVDMSKGVVHKHGCAELAPCGDLKGYQTIDACVRHKYSPCKCCKEEYRRALRHRNVGIIECSEFNYLFTPTSNVFHKYTCGCMLNASLIQGTIRFASAVDTGRVPCAICKPSPTDTPRPVAYAAKKRAAAKKNKSRSLSKKEKLAIERYTQAKKARSAAAPKFAEMTDTEKRDYMTLTQPSYVFWAAEGYSTFHTRGCRKMHGLQKLKGFSSFADANRAGYRPCKLCKPTAKMDAGVSIPISSKPRQNESIDELETACRNAGYSFNYDAPHFTLQTPVGIWRINTSVKPVPLHHINLAMTPDNTGSFHKQPRMFLSLLDVFDYVRRHDRALEERVSSGQYIHVYLHKKDS